MSAPVRRPYEFFAGGNNVGILSDVSSSNTRWWSEPVLRRNFSSAALNSIALW